MTGEARRLTVTGAASLPLLLRVVNLVAQRDLAVRRVEAVMADDAVVVTIDLPAPPAAALETMVERLRMSVEVSAVMVGSVHDGRKVEAVPT